jgi:hypothetical protein
MPNGGDEMDKQMLREGLEREAIRGATLGELEAEIDKRRRLLTDDEREAAWLYAWALVKRQERRLLASARERDHHDYAGGG